MSEPKLLRRFKQVFGGLSEYLAEEVCYFEVESDRIKSVFRLKNGSTHEGPTTSKKNYELSMEGYDIVYVRRDGSESRSRVVGMLENSAFEEIKEEIKTLPVEVSVVIESPEELGEQKVA